MARVRRKMVAAVHCSGASPLLEGVDAEALPQNCKEILDAYPEGIHMCRYGCLGGGSCVSACRKGALSLAGGAAKVDRARCVGCGLCVRACPQHLISLMPADDAFEVRCSNADTPAAARRACPESCIGCGICERMCPADAVHVIGGHAQIDVEKCISCGMCAAHCPRHIIHDIDGIITAER